MKVARMWHYVKFHHTRTPIVPSPDSKTTPLGHVPSPHARRVNPHSPLAGGIERASHTKSYQPLIREDEPPQLLWWEWLAYVLFALVLLAFLVGFGAVLLFGGVPW